MKCLALLALVGTAVAFPMPQRPQGYAPAPAPAPCAPPQPYSFEYGVVDQYSGANFQKVENQDEYGTITGTYTSYLPGGRNQIVTYTAATLLIWPITYVKEF